MQVRIQMRPGWMTRVAIFCGSILGGVSVLLGKKPHIAAVDDEFEQGLKKLRALPREELGEVLDMDLDDFDLAEQIRCHPAFLALCKSVEANGHRFWRLKKDATKRDLEFYSLSKIGKEKLTALLAVLNDQSSGPLPESISLGEGSFSECSECGDYVELLTDGRTILARSACQCPPEGPIEFELNVPSGRIVVANDLRDLFDVPGDFDINHRLGTIKQTLAMARIGCAHGFVGNSCPGVYRVDENTLAIASVPVDDDTDEPINPPGERVGGICTDLWWYSIVDADE